MKAKTMELSERLQRIKKNFELNVKSVQNSIEFDTIVQDVCKIGLEKVKKGISKIGIDNPLFGVDNEIKALENIRENGSLAPYYTIMYNQSVVLLVSYFASAIEDIFSCALSNEILQDNIPTKLQKDGLKFTIVELKELVGNGMDNIGSLVSKKKEISFQDMKSIARAFDEYIGFTPEKDKDVDNIIVSQACRHAIVHSGAQLDSKTIRQIEIATNREIKKTVRPGPLNFSIKEIKIIEKSMKAYVNNIILQLEGNLRG